MNIETVQLNMIDRFQLLNRITQIGLHLYRTSDSILVYKIQSLFVLFLFLTNKLK